MARLLSYDFEGNIRELKNIVEYAVNVANSTTIEPDNLPSYLFDQEGQFQWPPPSDPLSDIKKQTPASTGTIPVENAVRKDNETWSSIQREMIMDALKQANGKKSDAAKILGWGRSTLLRKIKQYKIDP